MASDGEMSRWLSRIAGVLVGLLISFATIPLVIEDADVTTVSNIALTFFTAALVGATVLYVVVTRRLAEEAKRTNDMAAEAVLRTLRRSAPSLDSAPTGSRSVRDDEVRAPLQIRNMGKGTAYEVGIVTDWGESLLPRPLATGETAHIDARISRDLWPENTLPTVLEGRFVDAGGTRWRQVPGALPELNRD